MNRRSFKYLLVIAGLFGLALNLCAQKVAESDSVKSIIGYEMQKRYTPINQPFIKDGGPFANSYATIIGSGYRQFASNYSNGPYLTAGLGKWFTMWHGARVALGTGYFYDNYKPEKVRMVDLRASYLFNLTGYVDGYDPDRLIEFYPVAGLGLSFNKTPGSKITAGPSAHLGVEFNMHIFSGIDLVVEPLFEVQSDSRKLVRMDVWRKFLFAFHNGVGVRMNLDKRQWGMDPGEDWFFTSSVGVQRQNSELGHAIRFKKAIGPSMMIGAGRYYTDVLSYRLSLGTSWHNWKEIVEGETDIYGNLLEPGLFRSSHILGRFEAIVNILPLVVDFLPFEYPLSASVILGPEAGVLVKRDPYHEDIIYPYVGLTGGLQLKCRVWKGLSVFMEPRASYVPYSAYAFSTSTTNRNYYDAVMSLSLGLEYRLN